MDDTNSLHWISEPSSLNNGIGVKYSPFLRVYLTLKGCRNSLCRLRFFKGYIWTVGLIGTSQAERVSSKFSWPKDKFELDRNVPFCMSILVSKLFSTTAFNSFELVLSVCNLIQRLSVLPTNRIPRSINLRRFLNQIQKKEKNTAKSTTDSTRWPFEMNSSGLKSK
jgi:hypothetical protein